MVALAAAGVGRNVQLIGKTGDDAVADALLRELGRCGVGHVASLRDPGRSTPVVDLAAPEGEEEAVGSAASAAPAADRPVLDAQDVDLALRYLTEFGVLVVAEQLDAETGRVVAGAAAWSGSELVMILAPGSVVPDGLPPGAVVFEAPDDDPDGTFATLVGTFAAALDDGAEAGAAFRSTLAADGWTESGQEPSEA